MSLDLRLSTDGSVSVKDLVVTGGKRLTVVKMTGNRTDVTAWVSLTNDEAKQVAMALLGGNGDKLMESTATREGMM